MATTTATNLGNDDNNKTEIQEMTTTTTKLTTDNKQKATSKTACDARGQKLTRKDLHITLMP